MKANGLQTRGGAGRGPWVLAGFGLLVFASLYAFFACTVEAAMPQAIGFSALMALLVTAYALAAGGILHTRYPMPAGAWMQLLVLFLLGHFLPFVLDDRGNPHLFFAGDVKKVMTYTLPGLLNFILCGVHISRETRKPGGTLGKLLWRLAVCLVMAANPYQAVIFASLLCVQLFFGLVEKLWKNTEKKHFPVLFRDHLAANRETLLFIILWCAALVLELLGLWGRNLTGEAVGSTGLMDALRTFREAMMNMVPLFHRSLLVINIAAVALALWRLIRHRETQFLRWQLEGLCCMGVTAVFLAALCLVAGDRYLVRPEVMLAWMGWLLLMTVSSLAYIRKTLPKAGWLLPLLTYMAFCETILNFRSYGSFVIPSVGFWG